MFSGATASGARRSVVWGAERVAGETAEFDKPAGSELAGAAGAGANRNGPRCPHPAKQPSKPPARHPRTAVSRRPDKLQARIERTLPTIDREYHEPIPG